MDNIDFEDRVERTVRQHVGLRYRLRGGQTWLTLTPEGTTLPTQGWKLHVSSRAATYPELVERLVPVLLTEGCAFKLARSQRVLSRLNNGYSSPEAVGKAFTIYPDQDRVRDLGLRLADLLRGQQGPRILSDRAVDPSAPVYYRYGPFTSSWNADARGVLVTLIHGPNGEEFGALATMRYRQPAWTVDPFAGESGDLLGAESVAGSESPPVVLGGHYRLVAGVFESGRGNVYRAADERNGATVVVKQARALVDEHGEAGDVRLRLRNERRVLQALDGVPGVPRFVDHFRHGSDEFLVTTDAGPYTLEEDVIRDGPYVPGGACDAPSGTHDLDRLGGQLARIVLDLHARGVVVRDLTTRNVVIDGDRATLIDFGLARYEGLHVPGGTPGYAPARQRRDEPPRDTDDLHALGMTLLFAAHGLHPVALGEDPDLPRRRALQTIRCRHGEQPAGAIGAIADLLSGDDDLARDAVRRLAEHDPSTSPATRYTLPAPPRLTAEVAAEIADNLLADLLEQAKRVLAAPPSRSVAHDAGVYSGTAGVGLELLEHLDRPGVADCLRDLLPFTVRAMTEVDLPPGLMVGRTGVDVFLRRAREHGFDAGPDYPGRHLPGTDWKPESDDVISGAAGVGLGHVLLHRATGDPAHLAVARRCAESVLGHPPPVSRTESDALPEPAAVEPSAGRAHGLAGTTELLLCVGAHSGDRDLLASGAERAHLLARRARSLAERARTRFAAPLAVSWCQGLTGITQTLLYAGDVLDDPGLTGLARELADVCTVFLPRVSVPAVCCGAAGVGNMLIDLALHDGDQRYWDAAAAAGAQMLLRSGGTTRHPLFFADAPDDNSASWAFGVAGALGFFRRLSRRGGTAGVPLPDWAPRPSR